MSKLIASAPVVKPRTRIKGTLFGRPGSGKSTLALSFPTPYYIDVEGGASGPQYQARLLESGGAYLGAADCSPETVLDQVRALCEERHKYKTLVIDSVTKLHANATAAEQDRLAIAGKADAFGASKKPAMALMRRLAFLLSRLDMNVFLIAHEIPEYIHVGDERKEVGKVPDAWDKLGYEMELVMQMTKTGSNFRVKVGKSRITELPEGTSHPAEFATFRELMGASLEAEALPQEALASEDQVAELSALLSELCIPADAIAQRLAEAKARTWAEAPASYVAGRIKALVAVKAKRAS